MLFLRGQRFAINTRYDYIINLKKQVCDDDLSEI